MAITKATLAKEVDGTVEYIYPKTTSDMVEYTPAQTVKDKLDALTAEDMRIDARVDSIITSEGVSDIEVIDARVAKTDGQSKTTLKNRIDFDYNALSINIENTSNKLDLKTDRYSITRSYYNATRGSYNIADRAVSGSSPWLYINIPVEEDMILAVSGASSMANNKPLYAIVDSEGNVIDLYPSAGSDDWYHEDKVIVIPQGVASIYVNGTDAHPCTIKILEEKDDINRLRSDVDALKEGNIFENLTTNTSDPIIDSDDNEILANTMLGQKFSPFFDETSALLRQELRDGDKATLSLVNDDLIIVKRRLDDLEYIPIAIESFTNNIGTVEIGRTITSVTFSYRFNKKASLIESANINDQDVSPSEANVTFPVNISSTTSYTLTAVDLREATATARTTINFYNRLYYGASTAPVTYDNAFLLGLSGSKLTNSKANTITVNATSGKYIYYCIPTRLGTPTFNVGGFDGGFTKVDTISHTNASGYTESYDIYKSDNASLGNTTVTAR